MAHYLVTGGAGFIGSNLIEALLEENHSVRVLDNFSTGKKQNLVDFVNDIDLIEGDIRDLDLCQYATRGVDFVLHQAALGSVPRSIEDPLLSHNNNVNGTLNMLLAARDNNVKKIVLAASSSAYGNTLMLPKKEEMFPRPLSPYAVSKLVLEHYANVFYEVYGLPTISLRYFNVFGPRQDSESQYAAVIPKFIKSLLSNESPIIYGDGEQSRDFTYISNVVQANLKACLASEEANGKVYNIACSERTTLNEVYKMLSKLLGKELDPQYLPNRAGDVKHSLADISLAKTYLNYHPEINFLKGLELSIDWYKENI